MKATLHRLLATLLIFLLPTLVGAINEQLKQHLIKACNTKHRAATYSYNSIIGGFTNISKALHFTADFKIACEQFDEDSNISFYSISFTRLATKIKKSKENGPKKQGRKRKAPKAFSHKIDNEKMSSQSSHLKGKGKGKEQQLVEVVDKTEYKNPELNAKDDMWYDMPMSPVKFAQHINGTILDIYITKEDHRRKSEVVNLKKSIALLFQTNRDPSLDSLIESDELGTHYSEYEFSPTNNGRSLLLHKTVTPDDFLKLQLDQLNAEKLEIFVNQYQQFRHDTWLVESVTGRVATYPIEPSMDSDKPNERNLPFRVEVNYGLSLKKDTLDGTPAEKPVEKDRRFVRIPNTNFTSQEYDSSEVLSKILNKKVDKIRSHLGGATGLVKQVAKYPQTSMKEANLLRAVISLESKIFLLKGGKASQTLLEEIKPLVTKEIDVQTRNWNWDATSKLLYVLSSSVGHDVDMLFINLLNDTDLMESESRPQFLNTLIQFEYPTDRLVETLLELLPSSDSMSITEHHLSLAISSLIGKDTIGLSVESRVKVVDWFKKMIEPLKSCPASEDVFKIFLESIANFLSSEKIRILGKSAEDLKNDLVHIVKKCREKELSVEAMNSLRNCLDDEKVQSAVSEVLRSVKTPCEMRGGIVDALVVSMELSSSSAGAGGRHWPRYGAIPGIDGFILTEWLEAPGSIRAFSCHKQPIARYILKKKGRDWYKYLVTYLHEKGNGFDDEELSTPTSFNYSALGFVSRKKRDDSGGNPLAALGGGGGGLAGGLGGFVFTPEVDCDNWNSEVGVNYTEIYENPVEFDNDIRHFSAQKRHCLFRAEFKATLLSGGLKAGFFAGRNELGESKLFGRAWMGVRLLVQMEIAVVQFLREQTNQGFQGHVLLRALSNVYLHEVQYACNLTISDWTYGWQYTTPAFRVTFGGFSFLMNADFDIRFNLTLWPSFCGPDGAMGIRFRPITIVEGDAYAELENDFFGLGSLATLYLNYYLDTQMSVPSGCFYLYHGNDDMFFKFDFYLKLPSFVFINFEPSPVTLKQPFPVLTWQMMIKKSSRYVLLGWCLPNNFQGPETPRWEIE